MSGSETGVMTSREPFTMGMQKSPVPSQPVVQNMRLAYSSDGTAVYKPVSPTSPTYQSATAAINNGNGSGGEGSGSAAGAMVPHGVNVNMSSETLKRKRGRPRKYGPDGTMALGLGPAPSNVAVNQSSGGFSPPGIAAGPQSASPTSMKKARGRPPGSSKKQQLEALGESNYYFLHSYFYIFYNCYSPSSTLFLLGYVLTVSMASY